MNFELAMLAASCMLCLIQVIIASHAAVFNAVIVGPPAPATPQ